MKIFRELKRRNVFKVGIAYAVTVWILLQLTDIISDILVLPEWAPKLILLILVIGFVPALIFAWAFEMTPEGLKLEKDVNRPQSVTKRTGRKLDYTIIILLGLALAYFIWESRFEQKTEEYEQAMANPPAPVEAEPQPAPILREIAPEKAEINENSIAVLPFANRSDDKADMYFTDGIHDDLLTHLSRIDAFKVISRTSVMEFRDTTKNIKDIARELSVANVMEGSVQRAGDRVRINVQLIDAETDEHLWAEIYDRELTTNNLFEIQSEIAQAIAEALRATLTDTEVSRLSRPPTENLEAYDLYLQGRQFALGETRIGYQTALELYRASLDLDPEFALAWIGLGKAHITNYWLYGGNLEYREEARKAIDKAKEIDATVPELYMAEGFYWYWGHLDYERALYNLERATKLMPRNEEAYMWHGWASRRDGQWEQALVSFEKALGLNPRVHFNWVEYGLTHLYLKNFEKTETAITRVVELDTRHFWTKDMQARYSMITGDFDAAVRYTTGAQHGDEVGFLTSFFEARTLTRAFDEVLAAASELSIEFELQRQIITLKEARTARTLWFMGENDEALESARAAMFRLSGMRTELGEDYRILQAEALMSPVLGETGSQVLDRIEKARLAAPTDSVTIFRFELERARAMAMAGLTQDATTTLDRVLSGPNETSVHVIDADPAFDGIRSEPEFTAMLERHR